MNNVRDDSNKTHFLVWSEQTRCFFALFWRGQQKQYPKLMHRSQEARQFPLLVLTNKTTTGHLEGGQGFQGYGLSTLRIGYLVPRMFVCAVFSCLAVLRIEACLNSTLSQYYWNPLGIIHT